VDYGELTYEVKEGAAWIRLQRPQALNALSDRSLEELEAAVGSAAADEQVRAILFAATGRAFCSGADLKFLQGLPEGERDAATVAFIARAAALMDRIESQPKPTIAVVNGIAMAGGMELVLACDLVIAARGARMGDGHANYGLLPGAGASVRLPRKIGLTRANYLFFTGDLVPAEDLMAAGLVNAVVDPDALDATAAAWAAKIAQRSPIGLSRMKQLARTSLDLPLADGIRQEQVTSALHIHSEDRREGVAAFNAKRSPRFTGR
jgi:enoyl-CoA hydratase/carnithine racemase